jgi:hypothetical protein
LFKRRQGIREIYAGIHKHGRGWGEYVMLQVQLIQKPEPGYASSISLKYFSDNEQYDLCIISDISISP